jgi:hypothetical protein
MRWTNATMFSISALIGELGHGLSELYPLAIEATSSGQVLV